MIKQLNNIPKSIEGESPLTWNQLMKFLDQIKDENVLNSSVMAMEHHHFTRIRFYKGAINIKDSITIVPNLRFMYNASEPSVDADNPYYQSLMYLDGRGRLLKDALRYSDLIRMYSILPSDQIDNPICIFDIWNLDDNQSFTDTEKECPHLSGTVEIPLYELYKELDEVKYNIYWSSDKIDQEVVTLESKIDKLLNPPKCDKIVNSHYHIEHALQPCMHIWEF